ncbi:mycofactocin biosynthesis peptidyl-dipeptidase MftE [Capillimicrobium parvum]|uniref:Mycofactocin system creatinine amidohydrolase family protein MftE n=1 Tax=Capillimicrobium parvum TaxID=2884022 RepID=A0A9E6XVR3_9ACTN|nr:mycofactocin biosynthesis peptidyl-dipeptidase MftE [Capillimicrobium parvum]UGS35334.1 Putative mycofactocin system creatinine amidohydrolase family protein MftE [Capillimicrobium parvum]
MSAALADATWTQLEGGARPRVLAVPVGSTEQHGPHLPLSTDTDIAVAIAGEVARMRSQVVVAPAVAYGSSGEHAGFPGTLSIGRAATELLLVELGRSASATFPRIVFISAHGGNREPVVRAQRRLLAEDRDVLAFFPAWRGDAHAGRTETSLMLAVAPERVRMDRARAGETAPIGTLMAKLVAAGVRPVSGNGVLGDPTGATAQEGRALLAEAGAALARMVDDRPVDAA